MRNGTLPGTILPLTAETAARPFSALDPFFAVSGGGISLSQLSGLTGLKPTTVQNWVKRGWVSNPVGKRYGPRQVARVLLINLMRPVMQLENIARLLSDINGSVEDESDDIVSEPMLYDLLACAVLRMEEASAVGPAVIGEIARTTLTEKVPDTAADPAAGPRLDRAVRLMLNAMAAARFVRCAEELFAEI